MAKDIKRLRGIYDKTNGYCHICHKKLSFNNHGNNGAKGAWHIEHSRPKARGGTDHLNNLFPACIPCNLDKGTSSTASVRRKNGVTRAPYGKTRKAKIKKNHTTTGAVIGGFLGSFAGPVGGIIGAAIGGAIGSNNSPNK